MTAETIRVLLVDDHKMMRDGLRLLLGQQNNMQIVGEAGDGESALNLIEQALPQVIIMDVGLPDADGLDLSRKILERWRDMRIIVLTGVADLECLERAMNAGVSGFLLKINASDDLVRAIHSVHRNEAYFCPEVSAVLLESYKRLRKSNRVENESALTERECQVLTAIAEGSNTKEIAAQLGLSVKTIETHRSRIMSKLCLYSVAELTKHAIREGYTSV